MNDEKVQATIKNETGGTLTVGGQEIATGRLGGLATHAKKLASRGKS